MNFLTGDAISGKSPSSVTNGDFNGDGIVDLATSNFVTDDVSVLLGVGDGTFGIANIFETGNSAGTDEIIACDLNGDRILDLATANLAFSDVAVLLGNGNGTFGPASDYGAGWDTSSLTAGDFNGDGLMDLAASNSASNNLSVHLNQCGETSVLLGDVNQDGTVNLLDVDPFIATLGSGVSFKRKRIVIWTAL